MRRSLALLCVLVIGMALPSMVSGGRPVKETDHAVSIYCDGVTDTTGSWTAYFNVAVSDLSGPNGFIDAWHETDDDGIPDLSSDPSQPVTATWDGSTLMGALPVIAQDGTSLGSATFSATLTPAADPVSFDETFRDGNARERYSGVSQALQPVGALALPDGSTFDLALCSADETTVSAFLTNPTARVRSYSQRTVQCELTDTAGNGGFLFVDLGDSFTFIDVGYASADGTTFLGATLFSDVPFTGAVDVSLEVYDPENGEPTGGTADLSMTLAATGEPFTNLIRASAYRRTERGEVLDVEGSLAIGGTTFDLGPCIGIDVRSKEIATRPQGPRPGGKVPANDTPTGARSLRVGSTTTIQTRGAAPDSEAPYECLTFTDPETGEVFQVPVAYTVWYMFTGTGGPMTIDTAGSDFDTVVAIYTRSGSTYTPVADGCVDDSPTEPVGRTLQANVTIPTVAGTTYYVQIGGYPEFQPYGNLRVALR